MRAPFPWFGDSLAYALAHVLAGVLRIDSSGRIWRCAIWSRGSWKPVTPRRAEHPSGNGYLRVSLHVSGHGLAQIMAHRLVYTWAVGPIPQNLQINHKDLNKHNNTPENLEPVTGAENIRHSYSNGRSRPWSKAHSSRGQWRGRPLITPEQRAAIRELRAAGNSLKTIATKFGVSISHAHRLSRGAP